MKFSSFTHFLQKLGRPIQSKTLLGRFRSLIFTYFVFPCWKRSLSVLEKNLRISLLDDGFKEEIIKNEFSGGLVLLFFLINLNVLHLFFICSYFDENFERLRQYSNFDRCKSIDNALNL